MSIPLLVSAVLVAFIAGATASVIGFGVGSLVTPVLAAFLGVDLAVAAVAVPHLCGGVLRGWRLRHCVEWQVMLRFGVLSAVFGLVGAFAFTEVAPAAIARGMGALLVLTALAGLTGWSERWRPHGPVVWGLGALSGFFGGVVGNQGGLRAAALSSFGLSPAVFVATSTVIGVCIDLVRTPVYFMKRGEQLAGVWVLVALASAAVLGGTLVGERLLFGLSQARFRKLVSSAIGLLGLWFLLHRLP
jgi:uncharacterized protein